MEERFVDSDNAAVNCIVCANDRIGTIKTKERKPARKIIDKSEKKKRVFFNIVEIVRYVTY